MVLPRRWVVGGWVDLFPEEAESNCGAELSLGVKVLLGLSHYTLLPTQVSQHEGHLSPIL